MTEIAGIEVCYAIVDKNGGWIICLPTPFQFPRNKVSDQPTSDSPTFSRCHLAVATSAGATLSPWEGLFRHTALLRREGKLMSCCRTTSSKTGARSSNNSQGSLTPSTQIFKKRLGCFKSAQSDPLFYYE